MNEIVIQKEDATFWMDGQGRWINEFGRITKPSIIKHLNRSIDFDDSGFFVSQENCGRMEKVYFRYEDTALFAIDLKAASDHIHLILNTKEEILLDPESLLIKDDCMFMKVGATVVKFSERALLKISKNLKDVDGKAVLVWAEKSYPINEKG